jgi:hypothetical protein
MGSPDQGIAVFVEEVFTQQQLYLFQLFYPGFACQFAERTVVFKAGKRGVHLAEVAFGK